MRIIAGEAGGRSIAAPKGMDTRPTLDRVRESLFSILLGRLEGAHVLDLFAGSGALGLEAISRGAAEAVFVDRARASQEAVARNLDALRFTDRGRLLSCEYRAALLKLAREGARFDLVFLDPPYRMEDRKGMLAVLLASGVLAKGALVVYEHARGDGPDETGWHLEDQRAYGDTTITFLTPADEGGDHAHGALPREL